MKKAMITIEVLVSLLILFLVIATSFSNIKFFNIMIEKKTNYEDEYMAVLSIRDKLSSTICKTVMKQEGDLNNFHYKATCEKIKELKTFSKGFEDGDKSGNIGNYIIRLYQVTLELQNNTYEKQHSYYITRSEKLNAN